LGRSRDGFSTWLAAATEALGTPCRLLAGPGQENDMAKTFDLIDGIKPDAVLADRACDADRLIDAILDAGAEPVTPPRHHSKHQHVCDKALRKALQQPQTIPPHHHALRQTSQQFHGLRQNPSHRHLAQMNCQPGPSTTVAFFWFV
jgi:transposase